MALRTACDVHAAVAAAKSDVPLDLDAWSCWTSVATCHVYMHVHVLRFRYTGVGDADVIQQYLRGGKVQPKPKHCPTTVRCWYGAGTVLVRW